MNILLLLLLMSNFESRTLVVLTQNNEYFAISLLQSLSVGEIFDSENLDVFQRFTSEHLVAL